MPHADDGTPRRRWRRRNLPHAVPAVAAILLEHARFSARKSVGQFAAHLVYAGIKLGIAAPSHIAGAIQDFLGAQREDYVGLRADEDAGCGDIAKHRIEDRSVESALDWIDPHEHGVDVQELAADLVAKIVVVHGRFGAQAPLLQSLEQ